MASAEAMGFQWGVKVYSDKFDFTIPDPGVVVCWWAVTSIRSAAIKKGAWCGRKNGVRVCFHRQDCARVSIICAFYKIVKEAKAIRQGKLVYLDCMSLIQLKQHWFTKGSIVHTASLSHLDANIFENYFFRIALLYRIVLFLKFISYISKFVR